MSQQSASKYWCFTWNNPPYAKCALFDLFESKGIKAIIADEVGESGTPHFQGYIECPKRVRWSSFGLPKEIHWEKRRGTQMDNIKYCSKDGNFIAHPDLRPPREVKLITPDRWWQKRILEIISQEPDDRTIWWFWEPFGGIGKTAFTKYLVLKHGATLLGGKAADMQYAIAKAYQETGRTPEIVVMNFPRCMEGRVSWQGLESIKDMLFHSGKYEGGMIAGNCPHVIVTGKPSR